MSSPIYTHAPLPLRPYGFPQHVDLAPPVYDIPPRMVQPPFIGYPVPGPMMYPAAPAPLPWARAIPPRAASSKYVPPEILEERSRKVCKHFEHHRGWCPWGTACHFLHDFSRLTRPSSVVSEGAFASSSVTSSACASPVPPGPFLLGSAQFKSRRGPRHANIPRTVGGTTYFPVPVGGDRLGYVTPTGFELFAN